MKTWRTLTIDTLPDTEAVDIPYLDVVGAAPEPRLTAIAGVAVITGRRNTLCTPVTILLSDIDRNVGPESVQSGRVMFM